jgi:DNA repair protein RecO (recombination protein O)
MALVTLDAITLRSQHYSESSRIVSFYSRERGLVKGIAKGARGKRARFGSTLEPLQRVRVTLAVKSTRDLQTVTEADLLNPYSRLREDLFRAAYAQAVVELLGRVVAAEQGAEEIFELLLAVLHVYEERIGDPQLQFFAFQIHLAGCLGYALHFEACGNCGGSLEKGGTVSIHQGAILCARCRSGEGRGAPIGAETIDLGVRLAGANGLAAAAALNPARTVRRELATLLKEHLEYHTDTRLALRALLLAESLGDYETGTPNAAPSAGRNSPDQPSSMEMKGIKH